jgi:hypothetical protein
MGKTEATWKEYLGKVEAHTAHAKNSLDLEKMRGEKKVELYRGGGGTFTCVRRL